LLACWVSRHVSLISCRVLRAEPYARSPRVWWPNARRAVLTSSRPWPASTAARHWRDSAASTGSVSPPAPLLPFLLAGLPSTEARRWRRQGLEQRPNRGTPHDPSRTFYRTTTYRATSGATRASARCEARAGTPAGGQGRGRGPPRPRRPGHGRSPAGSVGAEVCPEHKEDRM
jgi:hypothetical protein